jgi:hypothetical protein
MDQKKLEWLQQRFGKHAVSDAILTVGIAETEEFLVYGGHYPES